MIKPKCKFCRSKNINRKVVATGFLSYVVQTECSDCKSVYNTRYNLFENKNKYSSSRYKKSVLDK